MIKWTVWQYPESLRHAQGSKGPPILFHEYGELCTVQGPFSEGEESKYWLVDSKIDKYRKYFNQENRKFYFFKSALAYAEQQTLKLLDELELKSKHERQRKRRDDVRFGRVFRRSVRKLR